MRPAQVRRSTSSALVVCEVCVIDESRREEVAAATHEVASSFGLRRGSDRRGHGCTRDPERPKCPRPREAGGPTWHAREEGPGGVERAPRPRPGSPPSSDPRLGNCPKWLLLQPGAHWPPMHLWPLRFPGSSPTTSKPFVGTSARRHSVRVDLPTYRAPNRSVHSGLLRADTRASAAPSSGLRQVPPSNAFALARP